MRYGEMTPAEFLERPNRFIARCRLMDGREVEAHVSNTGRCRELLVPGFTVYLEHSGNPKRRTRYSLVAVQRGRRLINLDSQAPNRVALEGLLSGAVQLPMEPGDQLVEVRREVPWGRSRLDLLAVTRREQILTEVKGVTLEEDGVALFPDAPTQRGVRHLEELTQAAQSGQRSCVLFVVQMQGVSWFAPNRRTHPQFAQALLAAREAGVALLAYDCRVEPGLLEIGSPVEVRL